MRKTVAEMAGELKRILRPAAGGERPVWIRAAWYFANEALLANRLNPFSFTRRVALSLFGAQVGAGVVIKPGVRVKLPWKLRLGDGAALGEDAWIDNIEQVEIGAGAIVSQGAYLCTGDHDWRDPGMPLKARPITVEDRAWVGARAVLGPGVRVGKNALVKVGSVVTRDVPPIADADRWRPKS